MYLSSTNSRKLYLSTVRLTGKLTLLIHCPLDGEAYSGTQCTAQKFQAFLSTQGLVSSMSGVGNCYDNAVAESFFGLLKRERLHSQQYLTRAEAR